MELRGVLLETARTIVETTGGRLNAATVRRWLEGLGYSVTDEKPAESFSWHLLIKGPDTKVTHAFGAKDHIHLQRGLNIGAEHAEKLTRLTTESYRGFRYALIRDMVLSGTPFALQEDHQGRVTGLIGVIRIFKPTQAELLSGLERLQCQTSLFVINVKQAVGDPK